jgi:predicted acyltransferase
MMALNRLVSLDVLRGITVSLMILVNTPGSWSYVYGPLRHAEWNGCTLTDLVFPFFLFIVGVSIWFSFSKYQVKASKLLVNKVLERTAVIFLLGFLLNLFPFFDFGNVRVMGVLQRIALAYGAGALLCLFFKRNTLIFILSLVLVGYWALLYFGGDSNPYALEDNLVRKLDLFLFGPHHIYGGFGIPFDPEGLLSTIPAIGTVIIGYLIGSIVGEKQSFLFKIKRLLVLGVVLICLGKLWSVVFPINKALWTSSYVLYTAGFATLLLAFLIFIIDFKGFKYWFKPFVHFGTNPLFIFVFSGLYVKTISYLVKIPMSSQGDEISGYKYLFENVFSVIAGNMNGSLLFAVTHVIMFWFVCFMLYKNKIFVKI